MGQDLQQTSPRRVVRRLSAIGALGALFLVFAGGSAQAATTKATPFVAESQPVVWSATQPDGTPVGSTVIIDTAEVGTADQLPSGATLQAGQPYFYVALHPTFVYSNDPQTPVPMPVTPATLTTPTGTVMGIPAAASSFTVDGAWYFPLNGTISAITLQVASFTKVLGNERGDFGTWTFAPTPITFATTQVAAAPGAGRSLSSPGSGGGRSTTNGSTAAGSNGASGTPVGLTIGAGVAGVLALGAATAGAVMIRRRRAFARADREGRVVLSGPPALAAGAAGLAGAGVAPGSQRIVVKLLGPLVVDGTKRKITHGPVLEIVTFLALHPDESFTSIQLRESIWGLGRVPIASQTFRKYMVELRKAFGTGVVVTDAHHYVLTDTVTSDWELFHSFLAADDELTGQADALGLVRGPVLHGSFVGKKNSPFLWAFDTASVIENDVVDVAGELALAYLDLGESERASRAVRQGILCSSTNLWLRTIDLKVGVAIGGPRELDRRLDTGRAALATFPNDVVELERAAGSLGWVGVASD